MGQPATHTAIRVYATNSIVHHIRTALVTPFADDKLAARLLLHEDEAIVADVLLGVNHTDVIAFVEHFKIAKTEDGRWHAAKLTHSMAMRAVGVEGDSRAAYMLDAIQLLSGISKKSYPGALAMEVDCRYKLLWQGGKFAEGMLDALIVVAELRKSDVDVKDLKALYTTKATVSLGLMGIFKSKSAFTRNAAQLCQGSILQLEAARGKYGNGESKPQGIDLSLRFSYHITILDCRLFPAMVGLRVRAMSLYVDDRLFCEARSHTRVYAQHAWRGRGQSTTSYRNVGQ